MTVSYAVYLSDPFGNRLADASAFVSLSYSRVTNGISTAVLTLPGNFPTQYIVAPDGRLEIWRRIDGGREYLDTDTTWLIKKYDQVLDEHGLKTIVVEADCPLCILREPGRIVNYADGTAQATKAATFADDQIKAFIRENIGSSAVNTRDLSRYVSVAANISMASSVAKSAAWRDLLTTCQEIANASALAGIYLAFDIVAPSQNTFEFRTYTQQRGVDHRFPGGLNPVLISPEMGNLGACRYSQDWRDEVTYALAGGQGDDSIRATASAQDSVRINASPFGLRETFVSDTSSVSAAAGLTADAQAAVRNGRLKQIFSGTLLDTPDTRYGVEWQWGDYVTAQVFGQAIDCRIDAVTVTVSSGGSYETIDAVLKSDVSS